jgi:hypothetical protein
VSTAYDRDVLVWTLYQHQRMDPGSCLCGWDELGASFAAHVADAYEAAARMYSEETG